MLGLAKLTAWSIRAELLLVWSLAVLHWLAVLKLARAERWTGIQRFILAVLIFSLHQWQNWLWGWQIQALLAVAAASWALTFLVRKRIVAGSLLATVASYSFLCGFAVWPAGAIVILRQRYSGDWARLAFWAAACAVVVLGHVLTLPPGTQQSGAGGPTEIAAFFIALLGMGFFGIGQPVVAILIGVVGLVFIAWSAIGISKRRENDLDALAVFGACALASIAFGRSADGLHGALVSRYVTFGLLPWCCLIVPVTRLVRRLVKDKRAFVATLGLLLVAWQTAGIVRATRFRSQLVVGEKAIRSSQGLSPSTLEGFALGPRELGRRLAFLEREGLALFRRGRRKPAELPQFRISLEGDKLVGRRGPPSTWVAVTQGATEEITASDSTGMFAVKLSSSHSPVVIEWLGAGAKLVRVEH